VFVSDKTELFFIISYCVSISDKITCLLQTLLEVVSPEEEERLLGPTKT
jgi:hypothetical protein